MNPIYIQAFSALHKTGIYSNAGGFQPWDDEQKNKLITEDDRDKGKKQMDELTREFADKTDKVVKTKAGEIMSD